VGKLCISFWPVDCRIGENLFFLGSKMRNPSGFIVLSISFLLLSGGCSAPDSVISPPPLRKTVTGCDQTRPAGADGVMSDPLPDCGVDSQDIEDLKVDLGDPNYSPESAFPNFSGQSVTFDDVANATDAYSACPDVLVNVPFRRIINGQTVTFQSAGLSDKIGPIEPLSDGFSRARYQLPETRIYSSDGKYYVDGGVVKVVCVTATFGYWWGNFTRITLGAYRVYGYEEIVRISGTDDVGVTSGWAWYVFVGLCKRKQRRLVRSPHYLFLIRRMYSALGYLGRRKANL
jgi:hypothetical protein